MADSKRLVILKALTAHLETVTVANGYQHDLLGKVLRGALVVSNEDYPVPVISVLESFNPDRAPNAVGGNFRREQKDLWVLLVQGWAVDDADHPTDPAHNLMADVKKCLAQIADEENAAYMLGYKVAGINIEPGVVRPADETSAKAYFWMRVVLEVTERLSDPYSLD
jgi:hypothetical protein